MSHARNIFLYSCCSHFIRTLGTYIANCKCIVYTIYVYICACVEYVYFTYTYTLKLNIPERPVCKYSNLWWTMNDDSLFFCIINLGHTTRARMLVSNVCLCFTIRFIIRYMEWWVNKNPKKKHYNYKFVLYLCYIWTFQFIKWTIKSLLRIQSSHTTSMLLLILRQNLQKSKNLNEKKKKNFQT